MLRSLVFFAIAMVLLAAFATAGHVCKTKDCSDIVGEALVKDNLGTSKHFTERHHDEWKEDHRVRRIDILRREKPTL